MHMFVLSKNKTVQHVASVTLSCANSTMGMNYAYILYHKYDICIYSDMLQNVNSMKKANVLYDPLKISTVCNVRTLLDCKYNKCELIGLTGEEIDFMIDDLTCG